MALKTKPIGKRSAKEIIQKRPKHRSPNYPVIGLQKAMERAKTLYEKAKLHFVPIGVAQTHWAIKPMSASGNQSVAALKAYGLIEVEGEADKRQVRISDTARRIILNSPEREDLIKQSALRPSLHAEIWKKYNGDLPTDDIIRHYLIFDQKFNEDSVDSFIAQFKSTISFAKLSPDDKVSDVNGAEEEDDDETETRDSMSDLENPRKEPIRKDTPAPPPPSLKDFPLYLSNSQKAVLYVPPQISQKDFELLRKQIENSLLVVEATFILDEDEKVDQ
jgi:hypothetical protein